VKESDPMSLPTDRRAFPAPGGAASPRTISAFVSAWVLVSAFLWPHTAAEFTNTWAVGLLALGFSVAGTALPWARYVTAVLAVWLFVSAWLLPSVATGTVWNNVLSSIAIFVMAFVPAETSCEWPTGTFGRHCRA